MSKMLPNSQPKRYRAYFIEPGLADYTAEGFGRILIKKEVLDKMNSSFIGMPVINFVHKDIDASKAFDLSREEKDDLADGVIAATGYDDESGWYWADMMVWDAETQDNIDNKNFSVSCAYEVDAANSEGGSWHATPYDEEVTDGHYVHMAIVDNPRYEGAKIFANSKPKEEEEIVKLKIFRNKEEEKKEEVKENEATEKEEMDNASAVVEMEDGSSIPLEELVSMYKSKKENECKENSTLSPEDEIEIDGEKVKIADLIAMVKTKENAEPPTDTPAEEVVDEKKQMANSKFNIVRNAASTEAKIQKPMINTKAGRLEKGKERYGSKGGNK